MSENEYVDIDFVIAWVDVDDPYLAEKRRKYLGQTDHKGSDPTRFANFEEIFYCLMSIRKYANWVRKIFIVTDNQIPSALSKIGSIDPIFAKKITIVDHKDIFDGYLNFLPTFNSIAIGSLLWKTPNLAEKFVYFNDDLLLCSKVKPEDFFAESIPIYRGRWIGRWYLAFYLLKLISWSVRGVPVGKRRASFKDAQFLAARKFAGRSSFFSMSHTPHPAKVSSFREMFSQDQAYLLGNISDRFRTYNQFSAFAALRNFELTRGRGIERRDLSLVFLRGEADSEQRIFEKIEDIESGKYLFACLNGLDRLSSRARDAVFQAVTRVVN